MRALSLPLLAGAALLAGCSRSVDAPPDAPRATYDPAATARDCLKQFDGNRSGSLEPNELANCPALRADFAAIDANRDGKLTAAEIQARVEQYAERGTVPVSCTVLLRGEVLAGATVTFEPEPVMGPGVPTATATSDGDGGCSRFVVNGTTCATLAPGLYRIRVSKDGANLPARYNTRSVLGREVFVPPRQTEVSIELRLD